MTNEYNSNDSDNEISEEQSKETLKLAHKRFDIANDYWGNFYREAKEVLTFIEGDQWDQQLKNNRESMGLPCLNANQLPTYLRQITNESRQNCPSIQVTPKNDTDSQTAEILADLIRGIEQRSSASTAYDNAAWYAAAVGMGSFRIISEMESPDSFFQELTIKPINDPTSVLFDPNHKNLDGSDSEYVFIITEMSKDEYKRKYGESKLAVSDFKSFRVNNYNTSFKWLTKDAVTLAEYYYKDYEQKTLYKLYHTSTQITFTSYDKPNKSELDNGIIELLDQREVQIPTIKWCLINADEILDSTTWPGDEIPVICVKGEEIWINGERKIKGAVKDAIDSQRVYNFNYSIMAEAIAMAPRTPWVLTPKQIEGFEHLWRDANNSTLAYLLYNPDPAAPPPDRTNLEPAIQASIAAMNQADQAMKTVFGMFGAMIGDAGSQQEAYKTVIARQQQSHTTTYHFYDNLAKAVEQAGHILIDAIPVFYSDERKVQLIKLNGEASSQPINNGEPQRNITKGQYGVEVETGPSYSTRRQDSVVHMLAFQEANPQIPLGDIIADESDWPGAKRIAARIRLTLPPNIQQAEQAAGVVDPKVAVQQLSQQLNAITQQVQTDQQTMQQLTDQLKAADELVKQQHQEILISKAEARLKLEQSSQENQIKIEQLNLSKTEADMSYDIKLKELALQQKELELEEKKIAMSGIKVMSDIANDVHDNAVDHIETIHGMAVEKVSSPKVESGEPSGIDTSFNTVSGADIDNA